jgi:hypothetical protein
MKKVIYAVVLLLIVSSLVFAYQKMNHISSEKPTPRPLTAAETEAARKQWESTPAGVQFKKWEASPEGKKVLDGIANISKQTSNFTDMEAVITSLSLPPGSRLGFGIMARINNADYILSFGVLKADEFQQLQSLKVNDKIIIRSRGMSYAPKYAYPIVSGDYVERDSKVIYKRVPGKGGC